MKKIFLRRTLLILTLIVAGGLSAHAATLSITISPSPVAPTTTFTGEVWLESGGDALNTVEGSIGVPAGIAISSVTTGDSALSLWPTTPVFVIKDHTLSFIGGTPKPLAAHTKNHLFTFTGTVASAGTYAFTSKHLVAYKSDGKGTAVSVAFVPSSVSVTREGSRSGASIPKDATAPQFVDASIGSDAALFDGKYFATFAATDAGSGVNHYEIQEGMFTPFTRADRYYVLKDQTLGTAVTVRAVDNAGNVATKTIPAVHPSIGTYLRLVLGIVGIGFIVLWVRRKQKK